METTETHLTIKAKTGRRSALLGAMFLMATSAIGPGFITQTAAFTVQLGAAFAFAILVSILVDIAVQTNVWRVIGVSGMRAQELGNHVLPGVGWRSEERRVGKECRSRWSRALYKRNTA